MQEHHFRLQHQNFSADFVLGGRFSLYQLAEFINEIVGFAFDHAFEFCENLKHPYRSKERYTLFADIGEGEGGPGVKETRVADVFHEGRKMVFHFDYGDDWMFLLTCTQVRESAAKRRFKKVVARKGEPPKQYEYPEEEPE